MSIVVEGVGTELITVDVFALTAPGQDKGTGRVRIGVPEGAVTRLWTDETEATWIRADVVAERSDEQVEVSVVIEADTSYPSTTFARWGENQVTRRGPCEQPVWILLDGVPTPAGYGLEIGQPGGPERDPSFIRKDNGD